MNTINPLSPIPYVGSSTSKTESGARGGPQPQQGQTFSATVIEVKPDNLFALDIAGNKLYAKTEVPLSLGQTLQLQVVSTSPKVELRIISDTMRHFLGHSLTLVGKNLDITQLIASLQSTSLENLSSSTVKTLADFNTSQFTDLSTKDRGELLRDITGRLGLTLETLLAKGTQEGLTNTFKAALLEIAYLFKGANDIAENANRLLSTLELYQLAQLQLSKENILVFPLPFPFMEKGYLLIENNDQSNKDTTDEDTLHFSLHLSLKELGNLQIDFIQSGEGIFIQFLTESKEKSEFIEENISELLGSLTDPPIKGVRFSETATDPSSELLKHLLPEGRSIVDTKA